MNSSLARVIAFYLPQFHPVPENEEWWGKGFTEWTNTVKAKPLFIDHYQPHIPADLGFYDLRVPETRVAQAQMAGEYGIEAFCYYHYWFAGRRIIERPFNEVLASGQPDFPFCLCWANQTWTGVWHGAILGMKKSEIEKKFDEIVAFSEIEKFLDTPVKRYSSGMYVRLAFAVAAHLEPEILIVDEVLAVGDAEFQKKCLGKMGEVSKADGRTILFVSHNMAAVRQLTARCLLLDQGKICFDGESTRTIELYSDVASAGFVEGADLAEWPRNFPDLGRQVEFKGLSFDRRHPVYEPDEPVIFDVYAKARESVERFRISGTVFQAEGNPVGCFFRDENRSMQAGEERVFRVSLHRLRLAPGRYQFGLAFGRGNERTGHRDFDIVMDVLPFEVGALDGDGGTLGTWARSWGPIRFTAPLVQEVSNG